VLVGSHSQVITLSAANDASFNFGIRVKLKSENSTHFPHSLCSTAFVLVFDLDAQEGVRGVLLEHHQVSTISVRVGGGGEGFAATE
jgi:hypothetical protein